ncbi:hypothetical protein LUZ60_003036 [Juncus effusus]|nr:hypothetical protein LUZ60_003036 [Juncus effusus]
MVHDFRSGNFSVHMVIINGSSKPVSMVNCMVGDHQWMLAEDSIVAFLGKRRFVFGLPGFMFGLELPLEGPQQKYAILQDIFAKFCAYHDLSNLEGANDTNPSTTNPWVDAYNKISQLTTFVTPDSTTNNLSKMERAVRTSAVVKLLSRSLLTGALLPSKHIQTGVDNTNLGTILPTMWVISDLLNALETGRAHTNREVPSGNWRVNVEGVMSLLRVMRAFGAKMVVVGGKRKRDDDGVGSSKSGARGIGRGVRRAGCGGRSSVEGFRIGTCGK